MDMEETVELYYQDDGMDLDDPAPLIEDQRDLDKGSLQGPFPGGVTPTTTTKKESRNFGIKNQSVGVSKTEMTLPKIEMTQNDFNRMD